MTPEEVRALVTLAPEWREEVRQLWLQLMSLSVFGDLKAPEVGAVMKMRKRALDLGEKWRSVFNSRDWIPQPREQIKNALASAANLRDSLLMLERAAGGINGGMDYREFTEIMIALHREVVDRLRERENEWANALDRVNAAALGDDETAGE